MHEIARRRHRFPRKKLEFHYLDVWDSGYGYDRVRVNQSIADGRVHDSSTYKIQHVRPDHQYTRLSQGYDRATIELRLRRQPQSSFAERPSHTLLVAARHQQALLGFVGCGVDEIQEAPLMSSRLTIVHRTPHRQGRITAPPEQLEYPVCDRLDR